MKAFVYNRHDNKRLAEISHVTTVHEKNGLLGIVTADGRQRVSGLQRQRVSGQLRRRRI